MLDEILGQTYGVPFYSQAAAAGGGAEFPTDNLIALFHNVDEDYDYGTYTWVASNDPDLKMTSNVQAFRPSVTTGNLLQFGTNHNLYYNAALIALMDGVDDFSCVFGWRPSNNSTGPTIYVMQNGVNEFSITPASNGVSFRPRRGGVGGLNAQVGPTAGGTKYVYRAVSERGEKGTSRLDLGTTVLASTAVGDAALSGLDITYMTNTSNSWDMGFIAFFDAAVSDEQYEAIIEAVRDNSAYGMEGYTP
jgi:hypothetical protein